jgi:hypothetical protein
MCSYEGWIIPKIGRHMFGIVSLAVVACITGHVNNHTGLTTEPLNRRPPMLCQHLPPCPSAEDVARDAARITHGHPEQGWSLLCNGVIVFEDTGELLPDGSTIAPHRGPARHALAAV